MEAAREATVPLLGPDMSENVFKNCLFYNMHWSHNVFSVDCDYSLFAVTYHFF